MGQKAASYLGNRLNTVVSVEKIDISFFKFINIKDLYIEDLNEDTLFFIKSVNVEIDFWKYKNDSLDIELGNITVIQPNYHLSQERGDSLTNLTQLFGSPSSEDSETSGLDIVINSSEISVIDGAFKWNNANFENEEYGINWDHIGLDSIQAKISSFEMFNDSFQANIIHLSGQDQSGFQLENLSGNAIFSSSKTEITNLSLITPYSNISGDLNYAYDSIGSYVDFINQVYMVYRFDTSIISFKDLAYFASPLEGLDYAITISGKEKGPVSDMRFQNLYLAYGKATVIEGRIKISGLPNFENTSFNCKLKRITSNHIDLNTIKTYPFKNNETLSVPQFLKNSGDMNFKGSFNGFYNNFVTYGTFTSDNGSVSTDLKLVQKESGEIFYDGKVKSQNFNLAQLTNRPDLFNRTSLDIDVNGNGTDFEHLTVQAFGKASSFDFLGYRYKNIQVDGAIQNQIISGTLDIIDTNINLSFDGKIDLSNPQPRYEFISQIDHLRPKQLHLLDRDSSASITSTVMFNFKGDNLDNIIGNAGLKNFNFIENDKTVHLETVEFTAYTTGKDKMLSLISDNIKLEINGQFDFEHILQSLNHVVYKWLPSIYSEEPKKPESVEKFQMQLQATRFSGFSAIFIPQVTFEKDLFIDLSFDSETEEIEFISNSSKMEIAGQGVKELQLNATLKADTFELNTQIKSVLFTDSNYIENVEFKATAYEDLIKTHINWNNKETEGDDAGDLNFDISFIDPENFTIQSFGSWINLNDTLWTLHDSGLVKKNQKEYVFQDIVFSQNDENIRINGFISEDPKKALNIELEGLNLSLLNPIFHKYQVDTKGILNGETQLLDFYHNFELHSNTEFENLVFNQQKIGDGHLISEWNSELKKFDVDVNFKEEKLNKLSLLGAYYPGRKESPLDLTLNLDQFPIKIIEPFTDGLIDQVKGSISGSAKISGKIKAPEFDGAFKLNNFQTRVIYLNEVLTIDQQEVFIRPNLIGADAVLVSDSDGKKALVNFSLFHDNFDRINYDLSVSSINIFRAFNTTKIDNDYFYGEIYLNPESSIGIESDYQGNIGISANVNSGPGTFVTIPFFEDDEVSARDYIYFKDNSASSDSIPQNQLVQEETFGLSLDMALNLDKNAEIQLIFDEFTNDKIQATGFGNINLKINENNDFNIYGTYEISEGFYLFTFSKVISKKFKIIEGGQLSWNGDPYEGKANIDAAYSVRTSIADLGIYSGADTNSRIPVQVVLHMTGNYMNPELVFSFVLPTKYEEIETLLNSLDVSEKNKQVFALLILNSFLPITGGEFGGSSALTSNSSEVISNQISNWISKISNDFDVGVSYRPGEDSQTADEMELAVSTQFLDDRILLETNFGMVGATTSGTSNSFVGEFTVSYKVNKKGNIVSKVFNRSNELNPVYVNTSPYTQGIGIAYTEPFKNGKNLGCIISNNFKKLDNKRDCQEEYYQQQIDESEENLAKINKNVAKSRRKQKERNQKAKERENKAALKKEE